MFLYILNTVCCVIIALFTARLIYDINDDEKIMMGFNNFTLYYYHGYGSTRNTDTMVCNELDIKGYRHFEI